MWEVYVTRGGNAREEPLLFGGLGGGRGEVEGNKPQIDVAWRIREWRSN